MRPAQMRCWASEAGVVLFCGSGYGCKTLGSPPSVDARSVPPFRAADVAAGEDEASGATGWQAMAAAVTALSWIRRRRVSVRAGLSKFGLLGTNLESRTRSSAGRFSSVVLYLFGRSRVQAPGKWQAAQWRGGGAQNLGGTSEQPVGSFPPRRG